MDASHPQVDAFGVHALRSWLIGFAIDASTLAGFVILITGRRALDVPLLGVLRWSSYGPLFFPLCVCLVLGVRPTRSSVLVTCDRLRERIDALPERKLRLWVCASIAVVCSAHAVVVFLRHLSFHTGMDLAIYANACRGALYSTMKGDVWIFADHFEPLLLLFTPLCRLTSPAGALLVVQLVGFALGAYGMYALARLQCWRASSAWLVSVLYLLFAGNVTTITYDFHLLALALGVIPWLWYALQARRYGILLALCLVYLCTKESVALSLMGFGAYLMCQRETRQRWLGAGLAAFGLTSFLLIMGVMFPLFRHGHPSMYFLKYYGHLGGSLSEVVHTVITRPAVLAETLLQPAKLKYLAALLLPFLLIHVRRPVLLLPVLPAILINVLSNDPSLVSRTFHYEAEIYPMLFALGVLAFTRVESDRALWLAVLLVACTGESPIAVARSTEVTEDHRRLQRQLEAYAPHDRSIAAPQMIAAHLTDREKLYMFDYFGMEDDWRRAEVVLVGYTGPNPRHVLVVLVQEPHHPRHAKRDAPDLPRSRRSALPALRDHGPEVVTTGRADLATALASTTEQPVDHDRRRVRRIAESV